MQADPIKTARINARLIGPEPGDGGTLCFEGSAEKAAALRAAFEQQGWRVVDTDDDLTGETDAS